MVLLSNKYINIEIKECGPIKPEESFTLQVPSPGICLIVGPNMSGMKTC